MKAENHVLGETQQVFQQLMAIIESLPEDVRIEVIGPAYFDFHKGAKNDPNQ